MSGLRLDPEGLVVFVGAGPGADGLITVHDTGAYLTQNVEKSYRTGIEIVGGVRIFDWLSWDANITLSRNKIIDFSDWFDVYEYDPATQQSDWKDNIANLGK